MSIDSIHIILDLILKSWAGDACATGRRTVERVAGGPGVGTTETGFGR